MQAEEAVRAWLAAWGSHTLGDHLVSLLAGLVGSGVYAAVTSPRIVMPRFDQQKGVLHLGFGGTVMIGCAAAVVADYAFPIGVLAAVFAPTALSLANRVILPGLAKVIVGWAAAKAAASPTVEGETDDQ